MLKRALRRPYSLRTKMTAALLGVALLLFALSSGLVNTLLQANLITDRTRKFYAAYVDMDELQAGDGRTIGDDIADEGIRYLEAINFKERSEQGRANLPN